MTSELEDRFAFLWDSRYPDIDLHTEHVFHPKRKWRFDFAQLEAKVAIEINGGRWSKSGHSSGAGLLRDYEKSNNAQMLGWVVFALCDDMITEEWCDRIAELIQEKFSS